MTFAVPIQDPLIQAVVSEFCRRLSPRGQIAWIAETGSKVVLVHVSTRARMATAAIASRDLPSVGIEEANPWRLILIDAVSTRGAMDETRRRTLARKLRRPGLGLIFVSAFQTRADLTILAKPPWGTVAWFADEPDHFIEFNGGRIRSRR
jgi:hypothetical protein